VFRVSSLNLLSAVNVCVQKWLIQQHCWLCSSNRIELIILLNLYGTSNPVCSPEFIMENGVCILPIFFHSCRTVLNVLLTNWPDSGNIFSDRPTQFVCL